MPITVDCDDIQTAASTDFTQRLCTTLWLDPEKVQFSWPKLSEKEREATHPSLYASQRTLLESEGVDPWLAARNRDLVEEEAGWEKEFGEDVEMVRRMVREAEMQYRWLVERRFQ